MALYSSIGMVRGRFFPSDSRPLGFANRLGHSLPCTHPPGGEKSWQNRSTWGLLDALRGLDLPGVKASPGNPIKDVLLARFRPGAGFSFAYSCNRKLENEHSNFLLEAVIE